MTTDVLFEAIRPHLATDEGQRFLKGLATQDEVRVLLFHPFTLLRFAHNYSLPFSPLTLATSLMKLKLTLHIQSLLFRHNSPEASQYFNQLLLKFMWEEISPSTLQAELQDLFTSNPSLETSDLLTDLSPVLTARANMDAEQASV